MRAYIRARALIHTHTLTGCQRWYLPCIFQQHREYILIWHVRCRWTLNICDSWRQLWPLLLLLIRLHQLLRLFLFQIWIGTLRCRCHFLFMCAWCACLCATIHINRDKKKCTENDRKWLNPCVRRRWKQRKTRRNSISFSFSFYSSIYLAEKRYDVRCDRLRRHSVVYLLLRATLNQTSAPDASHSQPKCLYNYVCGRAHTHTHSYSQTYSHVHTWPCA